MFKNDKKITYLIKMICKWMDTVDETSKDGTFYLNEYGTHNLRQDLNFIWSELYGMNKEEEE